MTKQFEEDLGSLKQQLLKMAAKAETMIHLSMQALVQRDLSLAAELPELEDVRKSARQTHVQTEGQKLWLARRSPDWQRPFPISDKTVWVLLPK